MAKIDEKWERSQLHQTSDRKEGVMEAYRHVNKVAGELFCKDDPRCTFVRELAGDLKKLAKAHQDQENKHRAALNLPLSTEIQ